MKVLLFGKTVKNIEGLVKDLGLQIVRENPDIIISYGGDGTLISAERKYPGIPKLPLRDSLICKKCSKHEDEIVLKKLLANRLKPTEYSKLETTFFYQTFYALNDFVIRNSNPTHTIRFKTSSTKDRLLIGDGIVISTAFGSTGYFKSITGKSFQQGFAVAFNNTTQKISPVFLKDQEKLNFKLTRGKATLSFDNSPDIFNLDEGSEVNFKLSSKVAKIYADTSLRCPNCQVIRD